METFNLGNCVINSTQCSDVVLTISRQWKIGDKCTAISDTMQCTGNISEIDPNGDIWLNTIRFPKLFCTYINA